MQDLIMVSLWFIFMCWNLHFDIMLWNLTYFIENINEKTMDVEPKIQLKGQNISQVRLNNKFLET